MALLERANAIDSRNIPVLRYLASLHTDYRQYDKGQDYRRRLLELRPDDTFLQSTYCLVDYWRSGSWVAYDRLSRRRGGTGAAAFPDAASAWSDIELRRATGRRDFAEALRIIELEAAQPASSASGPSYNLLLTSIAARAAGQESKASASARQLLESAGSQLMRVAKRDELLLNQSMALALLHERTEAFTAHEQAVAAAKRDGDRCWTELVRRSVADLHALLGERDQALAEIVANSRMPAFFIHEQNVNLALASLYSDPRFRAIIDNPASNAPLPFEMSVDGGKSG